MVLHILLIAAASAAVAVPSPAPVPPPAASALHEIGHVRSSPLCAEIVLHANSAISSTLRNDQTISQTVGKLRDVDLDDNPLTRRNGLGALGDLAKDLHAASMAGDREVKTLRSIAEKSTDPTQRAELKAFADELGGALYRQKKISMDLNGLLAAFDYHDMAKLDDSRRKMNVATVGTASGEYQVGNGSVRAQLPSESNLYPLRAGNDSDTTLAHFAAQDFLNRTLDINADESAAAEHATGVASGC